MIKLICDYCGKEYRAKPYQANYSKTHCCSYSCSARLRNPIESAYKHTPEETIKKIEHLYCKTNKTVSEISKEVGLFRTTIYRYAKKYNWKKFKRDFSTRTNYRRAAEKKIGRKLHKNEHVHHIDGDVENNLPNNLAIFDGPKMHSQCHGSLEQCAFKLFKQGIIHFDEINKIYFLPK